MASLVIMGLGLALLVGILFLLYWSGGITELFALFIFSLIFFIGILLSIFTKRESLIVSFYIIGILFILVYRWGYPAYKKTIKEE